MTGAGEPLLRLEDVRTWFLSERGVARAVDGVSLEVRSGETVGLVGESGCGKSVLALTLLGLVPDPPGRTVGGRALFRGRDLLALGPEDLRRVRGEGIAMVFQEPASALNPVFTVGEQIAEAVRAHRGVGRAEARARAVEMLDLVGIPDPEERARSYPHQLSGGMRQRVMIAMAMSCDPELLVADEPTTALDVTVQAQILDLVAALQRRTGMGVLLITHDLGVVAETADRVAVMYAGKIVESAPTPELFARPRHPYTALLLRALPELAGAGERLRTVPGAVPGARSFPDGCRFRTRCPLARERCRVEPPLAPLPGRGPGGTHVAACHFSDEVEGL